jgi:hypothetical protein
MMELNVNEEEGLKEGTEEVFYSNNKQRQDNKHPKTGICVFRYIIHGTPFCIIELDAGYASDLCKYTRHVLYLQMVVQETATQREVHHPLFPNSEILKTISLDMSCLPSHSPLRSTRCVYILWNNFIWYYIRANTIRLLKWVSVFVVC